MPLLVIAVVVAVVVALIVQDSDTARRGSGPEAAESNPYDEAYGTFEPITRYGTGDSKIPLPAEARNGGIITAHFQGPGYFDIFTRWHSPNKVVSWRPPSMYAESGPYRGTFTYGLNWGSIRRLEVHSEGLNDSAEGGSWEVTVAPISSAEELPGEAGGTGDAVFLYGGDGADWVLDFRVVGDRDFMVSQFVLLWGDWMILAHPARRSGTRSVQLAPGPSIVTITTKGGWRATIK